MPVDLTVSLGGLRLANPVLVAAGTFGYGLEFRRAVRLDRLGGVVTKTLTLHPRAGNPPPRLVETPAGMLNSVGLHNVGLEAFLQEKLPLLTRLPIPVIVSVLGETEAELETMCARLDQQGAVAAIELNLSCPNLQNSPQIGSLLPTADCRLPTSMVAQDPDATARFVQAARRTTTKPLIAKLSPEVTDIAPIAQAAERAGADALALVNTFTGMSIDPKTRQSRLGAVTGGLSGPAIRPLAVYRIWQASRAVRCPLIGIGGIVRAEDAVEFFIAGATAVAVGTATFGHPAAALHVLEGVRRYLQRHQMTSIRDLTGTLANGRLPVSRPA